jgi:two-component system, OmpR family, response regulator BaeR
MSQSEELTIYHHNGICLIEEMKRVDVLGREVKLTYIEFIIFSQLMRRPGILFSRTQFISILEFRLSKEGTVCERSIDSHIKRLRKKLFPNNPKLALKVIEMKYGEGYRLVDMRKNKTAGA